LLILFAQQKETGKRSEQAQGISKMSEVLHVTKRDGSLEVVDYNKMHTVLFWAVENISNVSVSEIEIKTKLQLYNKIPTSDIHETLINSAANLISEEFPNYQFVAARLVIFTLRKQIYESFYPPVLLDHVKNCIKLGVYDKSLVDLYSADDWAKLNKIVKHERDMKLSYAAIEQFRGKYLVQDRTTGEYFETPQMTYILIAAILFNKYDDETRMQYIRNYYDAISMGAKSTITLPTPLLAGLRTPTRQFSSCVLIETGDSLDSLNEATSSIVDYASRRAGIGINAGRIRAKGSAIRNGEAYHTGNIPFYKYLHAALKSCSQGGVRGASATVYFPFFHLEAEDLIVLKNNKGTEETRIRHMDYGVQINGYLYSRLLKNEKITLFNPSEVPDLYEAFFKDQDLFGELYEKYERAYSVRKLTVSAMEHFTNLMMERNNTGRIYIHNVDHSNTHSSFIEETSPVRMSNLCVAEDTLIDIKINNEYKKIQIKDLDIFMTLNDVFVKSYNIDDAEITYNKITDFAQMSPSSEVITIVDDKTGMMLECTEDHLIYTKRGYIKAGELLESDAFKITRTKKRTAVYDITVEQTQNFFANDILVHNCVEITLPTAELTRTSRIPFEKEKHTEEFKDITPQDFRDMHGEIALCTLGSINLGMMKSDEDIEKACDLVIRGLDELLDYQDYPMLAAAIPAQKRRSLGIGVTNLAYFLAKNGMKYSDGSANELVNEMAEKISYNLIKTSMTLAKEKGACDWFSETKYSKGILPIDTYKNAVDDVLKVPNSMDWEPLRKDILEHGMRNSTVMALMPVESCLAINQRIITDQGCKSFEQLLPLFDLKLDDITKKGAGIWYDVSEYSLNIKNENNEWEAVNKLFYNGHVVVDELTMADGSTIQATKMHKFKVLRLGESIWCPVAGLIISDVIQTYVDGACIAMAIVSITRDITKEHTFDLEILGTHSYQLENGNISHNSSQVINSTNGIEPARAPVSIKASKNGTLKQVVPEIHSLKNKYEYLWDMPHTRGYLEISAIFQKWVDQSISTNTSYNPTNYPDNKVPMSELIKDLIYAYKLGTKTLYYNQTVDGAGDVYDENDEKGDDEECDSCVL